jgi:hypothetical protein
MFKQIAFILMSAPALLWAQPAMSVEEAMRQVVVKCTTGCLVLSPSDLAKLEAYIQEMGQQAYTAGIEGCRKDSL